MSSDRKEPGATWQGPANAQRSRLQAQSGRQEREFPVDVEQQQGDDARSSSRGLPPDDYDEGSEEEQIKAPASVETAKRLLKQGVPVFIPLILAIITSLIVLPLIATHHASVAPDYLWVIAAIIVLVTIVAIAILFYARPNKELWVATLVGTFCLFALTGCFAVFGLLVGFIVLIALLVFSALLIRTYFHPVAEGFVDIVYAFGKYSRTLYPGPNMLLPWEKVKHQLKVSEVQWLCPMQRAQLSHTEDVLLRAIVSYQLLPEDAYLAVTQVSGWEKQLQDLFITYVQTVGTMFSPDDFISWPEGLHTPSSAEANAESLARREKVNDYLYQQVRDRVALWGVIIHWVGIRDVMLAPHDAVIDTDALLSTPVHAEAAEQPQVATLPDTTQLKDQPVQQKVSSTPKMPENAPSFEQPAPDAPSKILDEEVLVQAYKEVQAGKVTDPLTIREIAANFRAIASDPQYSEIVNFDAERAAQNLYEQANKYEERYRGKQRVRG